MKQGAEEKLGPEFFHHQKEITRKYVCFSLLCMKKSLPQESVTIGPPSSGFEDHICTNYMSLDLQAKTLK